MRTVIGIVLAISFVAAAALGVWIRSSNHANSSVPAAAEATMLPIELERKANKNSPRQYRSQPVLVARPSHGSFGADWRIANSERARRGADGRARYSRPPATRAALHGARLTSTPRRGDWEVNHLPSPRVALPPLFRFFVIGQALLDAISHALIRLCNPKQKLLGPIV